MVCSPGYMRSRMYAVEKSGLSGESENQSKARKQGRSDVRKNQSSNNMHQRHGMKVLNTV